MNYDVYLCLAFPLLALPLAQIAKRWLHPRHGTYLMTFAAVVLATASCAALGVLILGAVARIDIGSDPGPVAHRSNLLDALTAPPIAGVAAIGLGAATLAAVVFITCRARSLVRSYTHAASFAGDERLVVTPDANADAYAVPGRPGRIVLTGGMLRVLEPVDLDVLLAHEHAHLNHRHHVYATLARLAATANPLVRPLARAVDLSIERWADEEAATAAGSRRTVAAAISKASIASNRIAHPGRSAVNLGVVPSDRSQLRRAGPIPRRVAALLEPAPRSSALAALGGLSMVAVSAFLALEAASDLNDLLAFVPGALT